MKHLEAKRRKAGRPLSFDRDAALHAAMLTFWRHGYESTSVADLTTAMGITPPSLYAAFGDKKQLFRASVDLYRTGSITSDTLIDDAPSARDAARALLEASAIGFTGHDTPQGCLLATATLSCSSDAADVQAEVASIRGAIEARLKARMDAENLQDTDALAGHVMAVIQGMSTLARDGARREKLLAICADEIGKARVTPNA